jgi:hypothetical protein
MSKIIVSYRRSDTAAIAGRIFDRLTDHYGDERVFMDVDKIPFGTDFRKHIQSVLAGGGVLLAVVGPKWLGKSPDGSRLADEADPVRVEIETAMRQGMTVLPVLVDSAAMPPAAELPESMRDFAFVNAAPLDVGRDFRLHMDRVIRAIDAIFAENKASKTPTKAHGAAQLPWRWIGAVVLLIAVGIGFAVLPWRDTFVTANLSRNSDDTASSARIELTRAAPKSSETTPAQAEQKEAVAETSKTASTPDAAQTSVRTYRVLANVSGGVQNLRSGPALKYPLVVAIPAGATGLVVGACRKAEDNTRPWCPASWQRYSGWISSCCIVDEKTGVPPLD